MSAHTGKPILYGDRARWGLVQADTLDLLRALPDRSVDALIADPPYAINIAGEEWDGGDIRRAVTAPGERLSNGQALTRWTGVWAREAARILKPGAYAAVFGAPRTFHRLVAGVEDAGGLEIRDQLMWMFGTGMPKSRRMPGGLGTALKPAYEPILLARAALRGTVADNVKAWGTGALNIEAARVKPGGRWPANVALGHYSDCQPGPCAGDCPVALLDAADRGVRPSRFFYCAKASGAEREAGCDRLPRHSVQLFPGRSSSPHAVGNLHPTVKPVALMRWLTRLVTPLGGTVLDPFAGSGSTGIAAILEGRPFLGIERERDYVRVARARLTHWAAIAAQEELLP